MEIENRTTQNIFLYKDVIRINEDNDKNSQIFKIEKNIFNQNS